MLAEHAKKRRKKYASDPEYAEREKKRAREAYAERTGNPRRNMAREALAKLDGKDEYTARELSRMLERREDYIQRLINKDLWPDPRTDAEQSKGATPVFERRTAYALMEAFAEHLDQVSTYRGDHTDTTKALFDAYRRTH